MSMELFQVVKKYHVEFHRALYPWTTGFFDLSIIWLVAFNQESISNMHTDDTNITTYHANINKVEESPNEDLDIPYRWLQGNKLSLKDLRSEYMLISSKA